MMSSARQRSSVEDPGLGHQCIGVGHCFLIDEGAVFGVHCGAFIKIGIRNVVGSVIPQRTRARAISRFTAKSAKNLMI
jgi:hypothetical protein